MGTIILKTGGVVLFITVSVVILLWLELSPSPEATRAIALHNDILTRVHNAKTNHIVLDFSQIANFNWDHLWIFPGYTPYETIIAQTGFRPNLLGCGTVDENTYLVVFTLKNLPVEHIYFADETGFNIRFDDVPRRRLPNGLYTTASINRDSSKFIVEYEHEKNWDFYVLRPSQ